MNLIKKVFSYIFVCLMCSTPLFASYIKNAPMTVTQPDGTKIECFATGDEFYHWVHDKEGYTIVQDPETGYYVYAVLKNDHLVATDYVVGTITPATKGLSPGAIVSAEKRMQLRNDYLRPIEEEQNQKGATRRGQNNGTLNNIVIFIRFADQLEFTKPISNYDDMHNRDEAGYSSMYRFFKEVSYEQTFIPTTFYPPAEDGIVVSYQDIHPRNYFRPYNAVTNPDGYKNQNQYTEREMTLLRSAIEATKDDIPSDLDLDFNNDGNVDNICFIVRGATDGWSDLLWPHRWVLQGTSVYINGKRVRDFNFQLEDNLEKEKASVLSHEMFHTLGAPDFYRYSDNTIDPVGSWDLMCANAMPPQSPTAYVKWKYGGWIDEIPEIIKDGTYTLHNVWSEENNAYKIASSNSATEYFVIEYRDTNVYWDSDLPGSGLIIYRINTLANGNAQGPPDELYVFRYGGKNTTTDGEIKRAFFSKNSGRTEFSNVSNPPCFLSDDQFGDIAIGNISESGGETMTFDIALAMPSSELFVDQTSLTFSAVPIGTSSEVQTVTVSSTELVGPIFYDKNGTGSEFFIIEETDWNPETGGTLSIRYAPESTKIYSTKLFIRSLGAKEISISMKGSGSVAIDEQEAENLKIYPNPSEGIFNVSAKESTLLQVFSLDGKMVKEQTINQETQVDLTNQPTGIYLFKFENKNTGTINTKKVVLEK